MIGKYVSSTAAVAESHYSLLPAEGQQAEVQSDEHVVAISGGQHLDRQRPRGISDSSRARKPLSEVLQDKLDVRQTAKLGLEFCVLWV